MRVLAHMNNPSTSCHTHHDELVSISDFLRSSHGSHSGHLQPQETAAYSYTPANLPEALSASADDSTWPMDVDGTDEENHRRIFVEEYPMAPQTFGHGQTFMEEFDVDSNADKRSHHPYYPFASRGEWELASFLLRSKLSMANIDHLLKLELVRFLTWAGL